MFLEEDEEDNVTKLIVLVKLNEKRGTSTQRKRGRERKREMMKMCSRQGTKRKLQEMQEEMVRLNAQKDRLEQECQQLKASLQATEKRQKAKSEEMAQIKKTVGQELRTLGDKLATLGKLANEPEAPLFNGLKSQFDSLHSHCLDALSSISPSSTSSSKSLA
ncbi:hypothetical protein L7F22_050641 [Adiantum nelumboides]|nr:hypothetical protein [Adiantum nelumboides]